MNKLKKTCDLEFAPLRTLDDFVLGSARFQMPNINDFEKWGNRVVSNLLYYQSNYIVMSLIIFLIVGVLHPVKMAYGFVATSIVFAVFGYVTHEKSIAGQFKKKNPLITILLVLASAYFVTYMLQSLLVFLLGILLPIVVTFIHASLRLRNLKNKIVNKAESLRLKKSPVGVLLEDLGLEPEIF